ncbi:Uncharacterized HTH-type transcriptional regulator yurK [Slackia heliotrinireducens]|nr:GntR family transcriptional regulator [Slackia heliotrinireducens]VEG98714.1 Uncharacterized HTH-type transcriptional regulator yurK [Slackia heliotrinireducens]
MAKDTARMFSFEVDESTDVPLWAQLRNRLAYLITSGYYRPGEQLPTVRALASEISINYNTVNKAYLALKSEGYIESTRGRGAFVRDLAVEVDEEFSHEVDTILGDCVSACRDLGLTLDDVSRAMDAKIQQIKLDEGLVEPDASRTTARVFTIGMASRNAGTGA